jgi:DNA-binding MarR family transcriptional regulator
LVVWRIKMSTEEILANISGQEKQYDALYRNAGAVFGFSDCAMWVLYFLTISGEEVSQQDLIGKMMFPKQTINSAVSVLSGKGLVELSMIPGTRNKKKITLTPAGAEVAQYTVGRMYQAECRAVERMGSGQMELFMELYRDFYEHLLTEFEKEGIVHGKD